MDELKELLTALTTAKEIVDIIISNRRKKDEELYNKVSIRPVQIKDEVLYQLTYTYANKETHENLNATAMIDRAITLMTTHFKQMQVYAVANDYQMLMSKRDKITIMKKKATKELVGISHNKKKAYILEENVPNRFLFSLGIMNKDGKVHDKKQDKFRQINRFLELVRDIVPELETNRTLKIIDFGCGKSYLTFALYNYLHDILKMDINIMGLDLKKDVVNNCNELAKELEYSELKFLVGDIGDYKQDGDIDMVVTLHACDTATDMALYKAIEWNTKVILSVPCCQHELLPQIHNDKLIAMERHGIIKERLASLVTDSLRANILDIMGYNTQIIEFIDMEHTPKNILIRAIKTGKVREKAKEEYKELKGLLGFNSTLEVLLKDKM